MNNSSVFITGSLTNISPDDMVVGCPLIDEEIFIYDLTEDRIYLVSEQRTLEEFADDRGLYTRIRNPLWRDFYTSLEGAGAWGFVFMCPRFGNQQRFTVYSNYNKIIICDFLDQQGNFLNPYEGRAILMSYPGIEMPTQLPFEVFPFGNIQKIYKEKRDIVHWGEPTFQNGLLIRPLEEEKDFPHYILYDPFCQWRPPKYLEDLDLTEMSSNVHDIASIVDSLTETMNWDLIEGTIPIDRKGDLDWIASIVFDKLYFSELYYSVSRALWIKEEEDDFLGVGLKGESTQEIIIDFRLLKRELRKKITEKLSLDESVNRRVLLDSPPKTDLIDSPVDQDDDIIYNIFNKLEEEDEP